MRRIIATIWLLVSGGILTALIPTDAEAMPQFARKHMANCNTCHLAWPMLNATGRAFKLNGYKFSRDEEERQIVSDFLRWEEHFPIGGLLVGRPYDKRDSGDTKLRAIHEVEILVAGVFYENVSGFFEIEAEDETGFEPEIPLAVVGYHHSEPLNLRAHWSDVTYPDVYDTFSGKRRLTRGRYRVIDESFGGADNDGALFTPRQNISLSGRLFANRFFYYAGFSGVADDSEGVEPNNLIGRAAFDITPNIMVGAMAMDGSCDVAVCDADRDYTRYGFDAQTDFSFGNGTLRFMGAYLAAEDDIPTATDEEENDAWYVQGMFAMQQGGRPTWVPMVRYESYERNDGVDEFDELVLNLTYYFTQNIKGYIEYWDQLDVPSGEDEDDRVTLQFFVAF